MMFPRYTSVNSQYAVIAGFAFAVLASIPFYYQAIHNDLSWMSQFPVNILGVGISYMAVFFHEIGHTIFAWLFGYPTLPMFDFNHGGGLALSISGQHIALALLIDVALLYALWRQMGGQIWITVGLACVLLINLGFVWNSYHRVWIDFMGHGLESMVAGFLLFRALFDLAPRGVFERFLNAFFGFGILMHAFINAYGMLNNNVQRILYYQQKGSHGVGDFDKIEKALGFADFKSVIIFWMAFNAVCLAIPFALLIAGMIRNAAEKEI